MKQKCYNCKKCDCCCKKSCLENFIGDENKCLNKKWELLLSDKRFRGKSETNKSDARNPFENDYGRLISSAPIRRLQDKTQVFPLEESDFIRTRLTHSLEVSYIASSIGTSVENHLLKTNELCESKKGCLSSLLRVAGLVHDLGNPPFGHFGEEAIKNYFRNYFNTNKNSLNDIEKADLKNFDGNVQTFRILSKLSYFGDQYAYNLTYPSLASIIKYPSDSLEGNKKSTIEIRKKKFGYFVTETKTYKEINDYLQLNNRRHPAVYLLEAADDIAYSAADIEDGIKLGKINLNDVESIFENELSIHKTKTIEYLEKLKSQNSHTNIVLSDDLIIQKFRIYTQGIMIQGVVDAFIDNYDKIMDGNLEDELIDVSSAADIRKAYKKLQYKVFDSESIMKKELAGWEAISGLLDIFIPASESDNFNANNNSYQARLYKIISSSHRKVFEEIEKHNNNQYKKYQLVVDFISGMTDSYAIRLYQELKGMKI